MITGQVGSGWTAPGKSVARASGSSGLAGGELSHAIPRGRGRRDRRVLRRAAARGRPRRHVPGPARPGRAARRDRAGHHQPGRRRHPPVAADRPGRRPADAVRRGDPLVQGVRPRRRDRVLRPGGGPGHGRRAAAERHAAPRRARRPVRRGPRAGRVVLHLGEARRRRADRPRQRHPPAGVRGAGRRAVAAGGRDRRGHGGREVRGRRRATRSCWRCGRSGCSWRRWPGSPA